ncbi:MAG: fructosamine kinase family protein [Marinobacter sp.]
MYTKKNETGYADALFREAEGLKLLHDAIEQAGVSGLRVPDVYAVSEDRLEMTAIAARRQSDNLLGQLGEGLAAIHSLPQRGYGFSVDNYIGLNRQLNCETDNWGAFFVEYRLGYQVGLITESRVRAQFETVLENRGALLAEWLNEHCQGPSLLHGDLWSGNALFDDTTAWLIDPAVYYGDPEADIAMTEMFGGFGRAFYDAYSQQRPLSDQYARKRNIYNLYHFLNHYNLFGGWYLGPCEKGFALTNAI